MRYVSKPQEVEAAYWNGNDVTEDLIEVGKNKARVTGHGLQLLAGKDGATGWVDVPPGWWIVRRAGDASDLWPVDDYSFISTYEPTGDPA